jgi:cytidylate kinase
MNDPGLLHLNGREPTMNRMDIVTIDGPAGSGKSTIAAILAKELNYLYFDTGVMYRAVTLLALLNQVDPGDEASVTALAEQAVIDVQDATVQDGRQYDVKLNGEDVTWKIRDKQVEAYVSPVSTYAGVRKAMTEQQRRIGLRGNVVMVGRDIGTVVLPEAGVKIYLDASVEERARRRVLELQQRGQNPVYEEVLDNLRSRDTIDSSRKVAPLKAAPDAHRIISDGLSIRDVVNEVKKYL